MRLFYYNFWHRCSDYPVPVEDVTARKYFTMFNRIITFCVHLSKYTKQRAWISKRRHSTFKGYI